MNKCINTSFDTDNGTGVGACTGFHWFTDDKYLINKYQFNNRPNNYNKNQSTNKAPNYSYPYFSGNIVSQNRM